MVAFQPLDEQVGKVQEGKHFCAVNQRIQKDIQNQFHKSPYRGLVVSKVLSRRRASRTFSGGMRVRKRSMLRAEKGTSSVKVSNPRKYCS